ncbi:MAG: hypothetical protein K2J01_04475 [Clostridiales bacterium]|nr:hypothetical protein [Clostridiales bacterium]
MKSYESNSLFRRVEMYAMINSIENDFIENYSDKLTVDCIPCELINRAQNVGDKNNLSDILRGLDIQAYIEIANANIVKLGISINEKKFINTNLCKIINIRNRVMHPRLFEFFDYSMLKECFECIAEQLPSFKWNNVCNVSRIIKENPAELKRYEINLVKSNSVIENLPTVVDFDDTSFIGRKKEINEIKVKLLKNNVHILTILGDGGVGKTALTIKLLYDLLDDDKNPFELILWVTLKTRELNNYEFAEISNSINNIHQMYDRLNDFVGGNGDDVKQNLIEISKTFKTLLVLDNLETINTEDVRDFLEEFSENSKVIITSRIGLGEMEYRYVLSGLSDDDLKLYVDTLLELHGKDNFFTEDEKLKFAKEDLHANPLAIKWFVRGIADGQNPTELLTNKDNLIRFCMSNVYEKLSERAKKIIVIAKIIMKDVAFAELAFVLGNDYDEVEVRGAINELCKCNFLDSEKFQFSGIISITDFAQEFVKIGVEEDSEIKATVKERLKQLNAFDQKMIERRNSCPYSIKTFYYNNSERSRSVAAYYLNEAIDAAYRKLMDLAFDYIYLAKSLCPKYFECNKIEAYLLRVTDPQKAIEEYEIAKKNAITEQELRLIYINYKEFCLSNNDYEGALIAIEKAIVIHDEVLLQFERVKILACIGRYAEAKNILESIEDICRDDNKLENIFNVRKADIVKRESESIKDNKQRIALLKNACQIIKGTKEMDSSSLNYLSTLLRELMHFYYDSNVIEYVYGILSSVDSYIFKSKGLRDIRKRVSDIKDRIPYCEHRNEFLIMLIDYNAIMETLQDNEGIVYSLKDKYGFVKNKQFYQGIYFSLSDAYDNVQLGDIVQLDDVYITPRGFVVKNVKLLRQTI